MDKKILLTTLLMGVFSVLYGQKNSIDTVFIFDKQLKNVNKTQQVYEIKDADLQENATNLSEVLRFQTPIYVKENGRGAVSSASFRGTTAQQTAFVWNGIGINSIFLGQGDLNNISSHDYDNIVVKSGGESVKYGSAAIGGSVHLNNKIDFDKGFNGRLFVEYGSFNSLITSVKSSYSNSKLSINANLGYSASDNDYEVEEDNYINRNGEYNNQTFSLSTGYKINNKNTLFWHSQQFFGTQHYPIFDENQTKTKYISSNLRSLVSWKHQNSKVNNLLSLAYLDEEFSYHSNISKPKTSGAFGKIYLLKNDFDYLLKEGLKLNFIGEIKQENGKGYQTGIDDVQRYSGSATLLLKYNTAKKWYWEAGLKKELVENIDAPFLFSIAGNYRATHFYTIKWKASKNFRFPSFNDLYWQPGGNLDLKPEVSYQGEIGNELRWNHFNLSVTPYYNTIENMIRWLPTSDGFWSTINTDKVRTYGVESTFSFAKDFNNHQLKGNIGYLLSKSEDATTGFQLSYVPMHKVFGGIHYNFKNIGIFVQGLYNGETYTKSNEDKKTSIDAYFVMNSGINFTLFNDYQLGFKVQNLTNTIYETSEYYPLPKRNYNMNLIINF